jgi:hypothetical protein
MRVPSGQWGRGVEVRQRRGSLEGRNDALKARDVERRERVVVLTAWYSARSMSSEGVLWPNTWVVEASWME